MADFSDILKMFTSSPTDQKRQNVEAAATEKRQEQGVPDPLDVALDSTAYANKYGLQALLDRDAAINEHELQLQRANRSRTIGELIEDGRSSLNKGIYNPISAAIQVANQYGPSGQVKALLNSMGLDTDAPDVKTAQMFNTANNAVNTYLDQARSNQSKGNLYKNAIELAGKEAEIEADRARVIESGRNVSIANFEAEANKLGSGFMTTITNPSTLFDSTAESLPTLLLGPAAKGLTTGGMVANRAAALAAKKGASEVSEELLAQAAKSVQGRMMGGLTAAMEGSQAAAGSINDIALLSPEEFIARFPSMKEEYEKAEDKAAFQMQVAKKAGAISGLLAGAIAGPAGALTSKFELDPLLRGLSGIRNRALSGASNLVSETVEEGIQSGGGQLAQNLGSIAAGDETTSAMDGVSQAAGVGAASGLGFAGAIEGAALAPQAALKTGAAGLKLAAKPFQVMLERGREARRARESEAENLRARQHEEELERAASAAETAPTVPVSETLATPTTDDSILTDTARQVVDSPNRIRALANTLKTLDTIRFLPPEEQPSVEDQNSLMLFAMKTGRQLRDYIKNDIDPIIESTTDPVEREKALEYKNQLSNLVNSELLLAVENAWSSQDQKIVQQAMDEIGAEPDVAAYFETANGARNAEVLVEAAMNSPDKMTAPVINTIRDTPMYARLPDADKQHIDRVAVTSSLRDSHAANAQKIGGKTVDIVSNEIRKTGMDEARPGLAQFERNILSFIRNGDTESANIELKRLKNFAEHMRNKAEGFGSALLESRSNGGKEVVPNYRTVSDSGKQSDAKSSWVRDGFSNKVVDHIFNDAELVVGMYNELAKPLGSAPMILPTRVSTQAPVANEDTNATDEPVSATPVPADAPRATEEAETVASTPAPASTIQTQAAEAQPQAQAEQPTVQQEQPVIQPTEGDLTVVADTGKGKYTLRDRVAPESVQERSEFGMTRLVEAFDGDTKVGELLYHNDGTPPTVTVNDSHQRKGVATAMYKVAEAQGGKLLNPKSRPGYRTDMGQAFRENLDTSRVRLSPVTETKQEPELSTETVIEEMSEPVSKVPLAIGEDKNWFTKGFTQTRKSKNLDQIVEAISGGMPGIHNLVENQHKSLDLGIEQLSALRGLYEKYIPMLIQSMNQNIGRGLGGQRFDPKTKKWVGRKTKDGSTPVDLIAQLKDGTIENTYASTLLRNLLVLDGDTPKLYQPIAEAAAVAASQWTLTNMDKINEIDEEMDFTSPELRDAFKFMHYLPSVAESVGQQALRLAGYTPNKDASITLAEGLPAAIGLEILTAMHALGTINIEVVDDVSFVDVNKVKKERGQIRPTNAQRKDGKLLLDNTKDRLKRIGVLDMLHNVESLSMPSFGKPKPNKEKRIKGSFVDLSEEMVEQLEAENSVEYRYSSDMDLFRTNLGDELLPLIGYKEYTEAERAVMNPMYLKSVDGVNGGLVRAVEALEETVSQWSEQGLDKPVFYSNEIISNGRSMTKEEFSPKSDKLFREVISAQRSTLFKNNPTHMKAYWLTLAQSLGEKVEYFDHEVMVPRIQDRMAGLAALVDAAWGVIQGDEQAIVEFSSNFRALQEDGKLPHGTEALRALNAIQTHARFVHEGSDSITSNLYFEIDGKANGVFNAKMLAGLVGLDRKTRDELEKSGLFIGQQDMSLNKLGKSKGDRYQDYAETFQKAIESIGNKDQFKKLLKFARFMTPEGTITRDMGKSTLMPAGYGSSAKGITATIVYAAIDRYYEYASMQAIKGLPISGKLAEILPVDSKTNPQDVFRRADIQSMIEEATDRWGYAIDSALKKELGDVQNTFSRIYRVAGDQHIQFVRAYEKEYEERRAFLIAEGDLPETWALSREDEIEVAKQLSHLAPIYALPQSSNGIMIGDREKTTPIVINNSKQTATSISGGTAVQLYRRGYAPPGVKPAANLVIGSGDAAMMNRLSRRHGKRKTNVYDGWLVPMDEMFAAGQQANEAVNWSIQHDIVTPVIESAERSKVSVADLPDIAKDIKKTKEQINKQGYSLDQMSGHMNPYVVTPAQEKVAPAQTDAVETLGFKQLVQRLRTNPPKSPLHKLVFNIIAKHIPRDIKIHIGDVAALQKSLFPDVDFDPNNNGAFYKNHIFLPKYNEEVLIHELIHAATLGKIRDHFHGKPVNGVEGLHNLVNYFLQMNLEEFPELVRIQKEIASYGMQTREGKYRTVSEFLAWVFSNQELAEYLQTRKAPSWFGGLKDRAKNIIRRILGLPNNPAINTYMDVALQSLSNIVREPSKPGWLEGVAYHRLDTNDPDEDRLDALASQFNRLFELMPAVNPNHRQLLKVAQTKESTQRLVELRDKGIHLAEKNGAVFSMIHAVLSSNIKLDSMVLAQMRDTMEEALEGLDYRDLAGSDDPASNHAAAELISTLKTLPLADLVALAYTHPELRLAMQKIEPKKPETANETLDDRIRDYTGKVIEWVADRYTGTVKMSDTSAVMDKLSMKLLALEEQMRKDQVHRESLMDKAENYVTDLMENAADKLKSMEDSFSSSRAGRWMRKGSFLVRSLLSERDADAMSKALIQWGNETLSNDFLGSLLKEFVGPVDDSSQAIDLLLNRSKFFISRIRNHYRDTVPKMVRGMFQTPPSKEMLAQMVHTVGFTNLQSLLDRDIAKTLSNSQTELDGLYENLDTLQIDNIKQLARYMVKKDVAPKYRNAEALHDLAGIPLTKEQIDMALTLEAVQLLDQPQREGLNYLLENELPAMKKLLSVMRDMVRKETSSGEQRYNYWTGYIPQPSDPRFQVVLAGPEKGRELLKAGFELLSPYEHSDINMGLAYYVASRSGGRSTYTQGAMQTVESTVSGASALMGLSLSPGVGTLITDKKEVAALRRNQHKHLIPIRNDDGEIVAYERLLNPEIVNKYTRPKEDISESLGVWFGRKAEERTAMAFNSKVAEVLYKMWEEDKADRSEGYIALNESTDPVDKERWESLPEATKEELLEVFDGKVMVRKEIRNNAFGYRQMSVMEVFNGSPDSPTREMIVNTALDILGPNAYKILIMAERAIQAGVGTAKDIIVVRSGVVVLGNLVSNVGQLVTMGVPLLRIPKELAKAAQETLRYISLERQLGELSFQASVADTPTEKARIEAKSERIQEAIKKLGINPLIKAGELSTITEGLDEQDEYSLQNDVIGWIKGKTEGMPSGLTTLVKVATISKDTAIYQGLNRFMQLGDFTAKKVYFDHLVRKGMSQTDALNEVRDSFINYNINAGRARDYAERMGMAWFWKYKIGIQRIALRHIRRHLLRFLQVSTTGVLLDVDTLFSTTLPMTNIEYSIGPGQFFGAPNSILWSQLTD